MEENNSEVTVVTEPQINQLSDLYGGGIVASTEVITTPPTEPITEVVTEVVTSTEVPTTIPTEVPTNLGSGVPTEPPKEKPVEQASSRPFILMIVLFLLLSAFVFREKIPIFNQKKVLENADIKGHICGGLVCQLLVGDESYDYKAPSNDVVDIVTGYNDYLKVNLYYTEKKGKKVVSEYKIFDKKTNEDLTNIKTEKELRDKLGLYSIGTHTDKFVYLGKEPGYFGGSDGNKDYTYELLNFKNNKDLEISMNLIVDENKVVFEKDKEYTITFEVTKFDFDYEYTIKEFK